MAKKATVKTKTYTAAEVEKAQQGGFSAGNSYGYNSGYTDACYMIAAASIMFLIIGVAVRYARAK
jgi:hypothetical protein